MTNSEVRPLALVTGASSGIGPELAKKSAENGFDLPINAEDSRLDAAATALGAAGTEVHAVRADLRTLEGVRQVHSAVTATGRPLAAAALNAGVGRGGAFLDIDIDDEVPLWILERSACMWIAVWYRLQGGVPYAGRRLSRAASTPTQLRKRVRYPPVVHLGSVVEETIHA
jgi:NAD(P)-dependent dehydrogenase (short-subunit alcohol dehydrogenase family)